MAKPEWTVIAVARGKRISTAAMPDETGLETAVHSYAHERLRAAVAGQGVEQAALHAAGFEPVEVREQHGDVLVMWRDPATGYLYPHPIARELVR